MAKTCDEIKYDNLEWCDGDINLPGIRPKVYAIPKRDIVSWPTLPNTYQAGIGEIATYQGKFTLAVDSTWKEVGVIVERSGFTSEAQGTRPSKSFMNTGTFVHAGVDADATGFCRQANNDDMVYIFQQKNGAYRVIGNEMYQTDTAPAQALGSAATDEMGTTLTVTCTDICPAPFYTDEIVTDAGVINEP